MKVILPYTTDIPIKSYLHHAFPLSILYANYNNINVNNFIRNNYLQCVWYYDRNYPGRQFDFYIPFFPYWNCFIRKKNQITVTQDSIITTLKNEILSGRYVYMKCDEYYLKCRTAYQKKHFIHDVLIFGIDIKEKLLYIAGYDEKRKYNTNMIPYSDFIIGENQALESLKLKENKSISFEKYKLKSNLLNYLFPENYTISESKKHKDKREFGINATYRLYNYLEWVMTYNTDINIIPFYIFHERISLILNIVNNLNFSNEILKQTNQLYNLSYSLKFAALKYEKSKCFDTITEMCKVMISTIEKERKLIEDIIYYLP